MGSLSGLPRSQSKQEMTPGFTPVFLTPTPFSLHSSSWILRRFMVQFPTSTRLHSQLMQCLVVFHRPAYPLYSPEPSTPSSSGQAPPSPEVPILTFGRVPLLEFFLLLSWIVFPHPFTFLPIHGQVQVPLLKPVSEGHASLFFLLTEPPRSRAHSLPQKPAQSQGPQNSKNAYRHEALMLSVSQQCFPQVQHDAPGGVSLPYVLEKLPRVSGPIASLKVFLLLLHQESVYCNGKSCLS